MIEKLCGQRKTTLVTIESTKFKLPLFWFEKLDMYVSVHMYRCMILKVPAMLYMHLSQRKR